MSVVVMDLREADRILKQAAQKGIEATNEIANAILANADPRVPVDTGALRASGEVTEATTGNRVATVSYGGDDVNYAVYQEFGTSKMNAQPYLKPAIEAVSRRYANGEPFKKVGDVTLLH
jgi:HK97 gp10 family phage protein